jgi:hypothetical protein
MGTDVVIVGARLAGLCCARTLPQAGTSCLILEASDGVGGRVRTDRVEGFLLRPGLPGPADRLPRRGPAGLQLPGPPSQAFLSRRLVYFDGRLYQMAIRSGALRSLIDGIDDFSPGFFEHYQRKPALWVGKPSGGRQVSLEKFPIGVGATEFLANFGADGFTGLKGY